MHRIADLVVHLDRRALLIERTSLRCRSLRRPALLKKRKQKRISVLPFIPSVSCQGLCKETRHRLDRGLTGKLEQNPDAAQLQVGHA